MTNHSKVQIMHFIDNMQDSKRNLEQIQGKLGKKTKRRDPEDGSLKDLIEEMEKLNRDSLSAKFEQGNPKQFIKFLDAKIALLDSITDVLTELYKIKSDSKFDEKLEKWQPQLDACLDSAWRQLVQISEILPTTIMLTELSSKKPEIKDFISMRHAITDWVSEFSVVDFLTKLVETKPPVVTQKQEEKQQQVEVNPSITPKPETGQPVYIEPSVTTSKPVDIKPVKPQPPVDNQSVRNRYAHQTSTQLGGREHAHEIDGKTFTNNGQSLKDRYRAQKGDYLKTNILEEFRLQIKNADSTKGLNKIVDDFKGTAEYKALATAQRGFSKAFGIETSSVTAFNKMVAEKQAQLDEPEVNKSIQNR